MNYRCVAMPNDIAVSFAATSCRLLRSTFRKVIIAPKIASDSLKTKKSRRQSTLSLVTAAATDVS